MKELYNLIIDNLNLFQNPLYNYIAMAIIGLIAFGVAWNSVGTLYKMDAISGRESGSFIHWIVRIIVFVAIFCIISAIIWIVKLICSIPVWIWWTILIILLVIIIGSLVYKYAYKKHQGGEKI